MLVQVLETCKGSCSPWAFSLACMYVCEMNQARRNTLQGLRLRQSPLLSRQATLGVNDFCESKAGLFLLTLSCPSAGEVGQCWHEALCPIVTSINMRIKFIMHSKLHGPARKMQSTLKNAGRVGKTKVREEAIK